MIYSTIFHSGNTYRLTLRRRIMHALSAKAGDTLRLNHTRPGVIEITNPDAETRQKLKPKVKP